MVEDRFVFFSMGCRGTSILYSERHDQNRKIQDDLLSLLARIEKTASFYDPESELNRLPRGRCAPVSDELFEILVLSRQMHEKTQGAFDISLGNVKALFDRARRTGVRPSAADMERALDSAGMEKIEVRERCVEIRDAALRLDLSGIAKGYGVDKAIELAQARGARGGLVNLGGDLRVFGSQEDPARTEWEIEIQDPRPGKRSLGRVSLRDAAIATSGDYGRSAAVGDRILGHIFRPRARASSPPTDGLASVTVASAKCAAADALATAVFVLGLEKGLECLRRNFPEAGYLLVTCHGDTLEFHGNLTVMGLANQGP